MRLFRRGESASTLDLLVVGLGNPGPEHARDRHNLGWLVADELARRHGGSFRSKFSGKLAEVRLDELRLALLKPETYMNLSGGSVAAAARFFKVPPESIAVVHDEVDLEPGRLQVRLGGGLAGHNGLRSLKDSLGSADFLRVRVGVGRPGRGDRRPVADYVLSPFEPDEDPEALVARSADAVEVLAREGWSAPRRASTSAARHDEPGAPSRCASPGWRTDRLGRRPLRAMSQQMIELEFHISPAPSSSRPHTAVGTRGARSSTRCARRGSSVSRCGLSTASAASGMTPSRQRRTS